MVRRAHAAWWLATLASLLLLVSLYLPRAPGGWSQWDRAHGWEFVAAALYVGLILIAWNGTRNPSRKLAAALVPLAGIAVGVNWMEPVAFPGSMAEPGNWVAAVAALALALSTARATYHYWSRRDPDKLVSPDRRSAAGAMFTAASAALVAAQFTMLGDEPGSTPWSGFHRPGLLVTEAVLLTAAGVAVIYGRPRATGFHLLALWGFGTGICLRLATVLEIGGDWLARGSILLAVYVVLGLVAAATANWATLHIDWDLTTKASGALGVPSMLLVVLLLSALGHRDGTEALMGGTFVAGLALVMLVIWGLDSFGKRRTQAKTRRHEAARAAAPPRETTHMAAMSPAEWRRLRSATRRRIVRHLAWKLALFPFLVVVVYLAQLETPLMGDVVALLSVLLLSAIVVGWVRGHTGGDPLLLYGRLYSSSQPEADASLKQLAFAYAEGTANRIAVIVRAAAFIRPDGSLAAAPEWRGRRLLNTTGGVLGEVGDGEHLALVATEKGDVVARLADVAGLRHPAPFPRRRRLKPAAELHAWTGI